MLKNSTTAFYIRLSLEDENDGESNSIKNQRDLLNDFIRKTPELAGGKIVEFCDDGFSGTNFERPGVKELLAKVKDGSIQCIIVKDFSRFARNYIEIGDYLEQVFPFLGVRFISVNDHFDSIQNVGVTSGIDVAFKNLIYDLYSKDLSNKVREAKKSKMKKGDYISPYAPFGYKKSQDNKNQLVIDEEAAVIVKQIFQLVMQEKTPTQIAKYLNDTNILTPLLYKEQNSCSRKWNVVNPENFWTKSAVVRILRDYRYTGNMVNGKRIRTEVGNRRTKKVSKNDWIVVEKTHEAIISEENFEFTQEFLMEFKERSVTLDKERILYGKLKCGECNHALRRKDCSKPYYFCATHKSVSDCKCKKLCILEETIEEALFIAIQNQINVAVDAEALFSKLKTGIVKDSTKISEKIRDKRFSLEKLKVVRIDAYEKYKDNIFSKDVYMQKKEEYSVQIDKLGTELECLELELREINESNKEDNRFVNGFKKFQFFDKLTRQMVLELVDVVRVFEDERIEIVWNFQDEFIVI
jgi:site-specific DNA recombinase